MAEVSIELKFPPGVRKYDTSNARSETVGEKRSFSGAWKASQLCLVPATAIYEPNYEAGPKAVNYRIWLSTAPAFGIAGLWRTWQDGSLSFTLLTVNSDRHALMNRMHKPGDEKRSVVIVAPGEWDAWLNCRKPEEARSFLRLFPAEQMTAAAAPRAPRIAASQFEHPHN
ncbi:SOS response-associated peptidase [Cupriavidus campinensis]|uniref:SOS response-associated peptidase n=1 Tax=Cupriavidus campinensis TaxID=151783 RepID=UPI002ADDAE9C|nr:SOS response-associated peptidase family protein [Cupriavidus campinensis]